MATITMLKSKVHRATVTEANVDYIGSMTLDEELMEAAGMLPYERIDVADVTNGERLSTYVIPGERGSGVACLNGATAHKMSVGDLVIVFTYVNLTPREARAHRPTLVFVDEGNRIVKISHGEKHAETMETVGSAL
jgi:aspartate 1-decarboxylase